MDPTIQGWLQDPEFKALPMAEQRATVADYFESRVAGDEDFFVLPMKERLATREDFVSEHLGVVPAPVVSQEEQKPALSFGRLFSQMGRSAAQGIGDVMRAGAAVETNRNLPEEQRFTREQGFSAETPMQRQGRLQARGKALEAGLPQGGVDKAELGAMEGQRAEQVKAFERVAEAMPELLPGSSGRFEDAMAGMSRFAPSMVTSAVNPVLGSAVTYAQLLGGSYEDYTKGGLDPEKAFEIAAVNAAVQLPLEMAGNLLQIGAIKNLAKTFKVKGPGTRRVLDFVQALATGSAGEGMEEFLQQYPDEVARIYAANPDLTVEELATEVKGRLGQITKSAADASLTGAIGGGVLVGIGGAIQAPFTLAAYKTEKQKQIDAQIAEGVDLLKAQTTEEAPKQEAQGPLPSQTPAEGALTFPGQDQAEADQMESSIRLQQSPIYQARQRNQYGIDLLATEEGKSDKGIVAEEFRANAERQPGVVDEDRQLAEQVYLDRRGIDFGQPGMGLEAAGAEQASGMGLGIQQPNQEELPLEEVARPAIDFEQEGLGVPPVTPDDIARWNRTMELISQKDVSAAGALPPAVAETAEPAPSSPPAVAGEAKQRDVETFIKEYRELSERTGRAEKTPDRRMSDEESDLMNRDWKAYSRSRGYTEDEIADFDRLIGMYQEGISLGLSDDELMAIGVGADKTEPTAEESLTLPPHDNSAGVSVQDSVGASNNERIKNVDKRIGRGIEGYATGGSGNSVSQSPLGQERMGKIGILPQKRTGKQIWEMTYDEVRKAVSPSNYDELQESRPVLAELYADKLVDKGDPWGIIRAVERGDEIPRVPTVDLSRRHRNAIREAISGGRNIPPEVLKDYPDLAPKPDPSSPPAVAGEAKPVVKESFTTDPVTPPPQDNIAGVSVQEAVAKEPWQMTREENFEHTMQNKKGFHKGAQGEYTKVVNNERFIEWTRDSRNLRMERESIERDHKKQIENAMSRGEQVPPEVLKDYPDLAPKPDPEAVAQPAPVEQVEASAAPAEGASGGKPKYKTTTHQEAESAHNVKYERKPLAKEPESDIVGNHDLYQSKRRDKAKSERPSLKERKLREAFARFGWGNSDSIQLVQPITKEREAVVKVGRAFGHNIVLWKTDDDQLNLVNGVVSSKYPGQIFLNVNSDEPILAVAGHELTHRLHSRHPDLYQFLVDQVGPKTVGFDEYMAPVNAGREMAGLPPVSDNEAFEEFMGDIVGQQMTKPEFWDRLRGKSKSLTDRLVNIVKSILRKITRVVRQAGIDRFVTDVESVQDAIAEAFGEFSRREGGSLSQTGEQYEVRAFHGSPHAFDKFDTGKIGTGEGNQAFGYGLYFTSIKRIARHYAEALKQRQFYNFDPRDVLSKEALKAFGMAEEDIYERINFGDPSATDILNEIENYIKGEENNYFSPDTEEKIEKTKSEFMEVFKKQAKRNLYEVTLHKGKAPGEYNWLEWDKPYSKDTGERIAKQFEKEKPEEWEWWAKDFRRGVTNGDLAYKDLSGKFGSDKEASLFLLRAGIDGIKYPAGSLSGMKEEGFNYVVFDANAVTVEQHEQYKTVSKDAITGMKDAGVLSGHEARKLEAEVDKDTAKLKALDPLRNESGAIDFTALMTKEIPANWEIRDNKDAGARESQTRPPHWLAKRYPEFKQLYKRQQKRVRDRMRHLSGNLDGVKTVLGADGSDLDSLRAIVWQTEGAKIVDVKKFKEVDGKYQLNEEHYDALRKKIDSLGISDKAKDAFIELRKSLDQDLAVVFNTMKDMPDIEDSAIAEFRQAIGMIHNYFPHMRYGSHFVQAIDARTGDVVYREHFDAIGSGYRKARKILEGSKDFQGLKQQHPDLTFTVGKVEKMPEEVFAIPVPIEALEAVVNSAIARLPDEEAKKAFRNILPQAVADALKQRGWGSHMIHRKNIPGFEKQDIKRVLFDYKAGLYGWLTKMEAARDFSQIMAKVPPQKKGRLWSAMRDYTYDMLENADAVDRTVDTMRAVFFAKYLGLNVKTAALNTTQQIIAGWPRLGLEVGNAFGPVFKGSMTDIVSHIQKGKGLSADEMKLLEELYREGETHAQMLTEMRGKIGGSYQGIANKVMTVLGYPMQVAEGFNRRSLALAAFRSAMGGKITNQKTLNSYGYNKGDAFVYEDAKDFAEGIVQDSHFVYGKTNRPAMFRGSSTAKIASAAYTFRTFTHNLLNLWHWMWQQGGPGKRAVMKSMGAMVTVGGLSAIPLYKTAMHILRQAIGDDPGDELVNAIVPEGQEWLRDIVLYGVPAGAGFTLGGSVGMELPIFDRIRLNESFTEQLMRDAGEIVGVPWAVLEDIESSARALGSGSGWKAMEYALPTAAANISAAIRLANEGQKTVSGKPINLPMEAGARKLSTYEAVGKGIGFQPVSSTKAYDLHKSLQDFQDYKTGKQREFANRFANAIGNPEKIKGVASDMAEWNKDQMESGRPEYFIWPADLSNAVIDRMRTSKPPMYLLPKAMKMKKRAFPEKETPK